MFQGCWYPISTAHLRPILQYQLHLITPYLLRNHLSAGEHLGAR
jgi:hypothetical protein